MFFPSRTLCLPFFNTWFAAVITFFAGNIFLLRFDNSVLLDWFLSSIYQSRMLHMVDSSPFYWLFNFEGSEDLYWFSGLSFTPGCYTFCSLPKTLKTIFYSYLLFLVRLHEVARDNTATDRQKNIIPWCYFQRLLNSVCETKVLKLNHLS